MDRKSTKNTFPSMKNLYFKPSALVPKNLVFQKKKIKILQIDGGIEMTKSNK